MLYGRCDVYGALCRSTTEVAGLGFGSNLLRFVKQRLQGFATVPLPDTSAYLALSECFHSYIYIYICSTAKV